MFWFDFAFDIFIYCRNFINSFLILPLPNEEIILRNKTKKIKLFPYIKIITVDLYETNPKLEISITDIVKNISIEMDVNHAEYNDTVSLFNMIVEKYNKIHNSSNHIHSISVLIDTDLQSLMNTKTPIVTNKASQEEHKIILDQSTVETIIFK